MEVGGRCRRQILQLLLLFATFYVTLYGDDKEVFERAIAVIAARDKNRKLLHLESILPLVSAFAVPLSQLTSFEFFRLAGDFIKHWGSDLQIYRLRIRKGPSSTSLLSIHLEGPMS